MSALPKALRKRVLAFTAVYMAAYLIGSYLDLATTSLGLRRPGVYEKNVFATTAGVYVSGKAWALTAVGAVVMTACIWFAARNAGKVSDNWLRHPVRSFGKLYINPWAKNAIDVSPLHTLSLAIGFVFLRVLAAANNLLVYFYGFGPMGELIKAVAARTSPVAGFCIVASLVFVLIMVAASPLAAKVVRAWQLRA